MRKMKKEVKKMDYKEFKAELDRKIWHRPRYLIIK